MNRFQHMGTGSTILLATMVFRRLFLLAFPLAFVGCMTTVHEVTIKVPVREKVADLEQVKTLAILDFACPQDQALGRNITGIAMSYLSQSGRFSLAERSQIDKVVRELNLKNLSGFVDSETVKTIGKLGGVDAILLGEVATRRVSELTINFRVLDVETGRILFADTETSRGQPRIRILIDGRWPEGGDLADEVIAAFTAKIAPHYEARRRSMLEGGNDSSREANFVGISHAERGLWQEARPYLEEAVKSDVGNSAAKNNLGVVLEALGCPDDAIKAYEEAYKLAHQKQYLANLLDLKETMRPPEKKAIESLRLEGPSPVGR